jgi:hypothetical protein
MKKTRWSGYAKYLVFADKSSVLKGSYNSYVNFKECLEVLNTLFTKRTSSYLYNGDLIQFNLRQGDIESIYNSWHESEYRKSFDYIRFIANKLNLKTI